MSMIPCGDCGKCDNCLGFEWPAPDGVPPTAESIALFFETSKVFGASAARVRDNIAEEVLSK